jgi:hypothetical protein
MRKSAILITLFLLILQAANAQNQKGNQTLGIGLEFSANRGNYNYQNANSTVINSGTTQLTGFSANPSYSYFMANNLDIGISVGFGTGTSNFNDHFNPRITELDKNYSGSLYLRKYFLYKNKVGIRTGPYFSYQYVNSNVTYTPDINSTNNSFTGNNYHAGLIADFVYYPASKIGLAVNLGNLSYNNSKTSGQQQCSSANGVNLQFLNNNLMLSAFYVFGN